MRRNVRTDIPTNKHFDRQDKQEKGEREIDGQTETEMKCIINKHRQI